MFESSMKCSLMEIPFRMQPKANPRKKAYSLIDTVVFLCPRPAQWYPPSSPQCRLLPSCESWVENVIQGVWFLAVRPKA